VAGRAQAFSDPTVIALASRYFIPVAENCSPLQGQPDAKGEFFRLVAEQGHYGGRTYPTSTRQGYYAFTADGKLLDAMNARDPERMASMMRTSLRRWQALSEGESEAQGNGSAVQVSDYEPPNLYPAGGLVLRLAARDLPREVDTRKDDWRKHAWNLDYAWFAPEEARALVPDGHVPGSRRHAPRSVIRRLGRFHLRDFVRGEPPAWPAEAIRHGELTSEIVEVSGAQVRLALRGHIRLEWQHRWVRPEDGEERRYDAGYDAALAGEATWDDHQGVFTSFELVASGPRWGTAQYNNRADDLGPAPMGIAFSLAGSEPRDRTPPHQIHHRDYFRSE
jgi:hypothetical protein